MTEPTPTTPEQRLAAVRLLDAAEFAMDPNGIKLEAAGVTVTLVMSETDGALVVWMDTDSEKLPHTAVGSEPIMRVYVNEGMVYGRSPLTDEEA